MKHLVTVLAHERTGTNYFLGFINNKFKNIICNYEVFNPGKCYLLPQFLTALKNNNYNVEQNHLQKISKKNPVKFLKTLLNLCEEKIMFHKIFPSHLDINQVYKIIDTSQFIFILKRNFIDVYISLQKCLYLVNEWSKTKDNYPPGYNIWANSNTTNIKITFDPEDFEKKKEKYDNWYQSIEKYLKKINKKFDIIYYETFHKLSNEEKKIYLKNRLLLSIPEDLLEFDDNTRILPFFKQDLETNYQNKITNYTDFKKYFKL